MDAGRRLFLERAGILDEFEPKLEAVGTDLQNLIQTLEDLDGDATRMGHQLANELRSNKDAKKKKMIQSAIQLSKEMAKQAAILAEVYQEIFVELQ